MRISTAFSGGTASRLRHETLGIQPFRYRLESRGRPLIGARIHSLCPWLLSRRASGCERFLGHPPCAGATAPRHTAARITGTPGKSEIADLAIVGTGRGYREEGCPQSPRL